MYLGKATVGVGGGVVVVVVVACGDGAVIRVVVVTWDWWSVGVIKSRNHVCCG